MSAAKPNPARDGARELARRLGNMTEAQRTAMAAEMPAVFSVEGRALSLFNTLLLASQCPTVTMVGGFRQWLGAGRCVRKGESALWIFAPRMPKADPNKQPGEISSADLERRFIMVPVFDVGQTDVVSADELDATHPAQAVQS